MKAADLGKATIWCTPSVSVYVQSHLSIPLSEPLTNFPADTRTLIAIGGGYLLDESKAWIQDKAPNVRLVAIPSLWGSGAEASPIIVQNRNGAKVIRMDAKFLPFARVIWPELARTIPEARAKEALGDCWANALEGFLSPLADDRLRGDIALLMQAMRRLPLGNHPDWFELSAQASAAQAQSSVGLVHGIAHTLEGPLIAAQPDQGWGHAKLCAVYLWPVTRFNFQHNNANRELLQKYGLDPDALLKIARDLYSDGAYRKALPLLQSLWTAVLRDRCTRTNSVLVRAPHLDYFTTEAFV